MQYDPSRRWIITFSPSRFDSYKVIASVHEKLLEISAADPEKIDHWSWGDQGNGPELGLTLKESNLNDVLSDIADAMEVAKLEAARGVSRKMLLDLSRPLTASRSVSILRASSGDPETLPE